MHHITKPEPADYMSNKEEARIMFTSFHPFSERVENLLGKTSAFALSTIITALMVLWALTTLIPAGRMYETAVGLLWTAFVVWVVLFFAYMISKVIFNRKKVALFRKHEPRAARTLWGKE